MKRIVVAVGLLALSTSPVAANEADPLIFASATTGNVLMKICGESWSAGKYDPCGSYLTGIIDGMGIAGNLLCPPSTPDIVNQMATVAYRAVRDQPERWHYPASWLAQEALTEHFGCNLKQ